MLLTVPLLLPLLIEAEITKNIPICICILIDKLFSGQRKSRQVQICTELTKLTYRIGVRGAFVWWRTVIPRFTWFPAECYKTNGTLKDLIVFQWKIKILIQFFLLLTRWTILSSETGTTHLSKLINNNPSVSCASAKARHGNHITSTMYYVSWYRSYALLCLVSLFSLDFSVLVKAII